MNVAGTSTTFARAPEGARACETTRHLSELLAAIEAGCSEVYDAAYLGLAVRTGPRAAARDRDPALSASARALPQLLHL
jgi:hypothetical protein